MASVLTTFRNETKTKVKDNGYDFDYSACFSRYIIAFSGDNYQGIKASCAFIVDKMPL
jgi:hypothetical protein